MQLLKGKKALVTGGTAGIGKEIAATFARHGAEVCIWGTNEQRAKETAEELQVLWKIVDVSDKKAVDAAIAELLATWGNVDILVNNAGITRDGLLMKMGEEDWDAVLNTNLKSAFNTCQSIVRPMLKARSGKIINISSVVGLTGNAGQVNYSASKSGMIGLTKALAQEVATRGICVNCVAPGFIMTRMTDALTELQKEGILKKIPMGRMGNPQDVANAVLYFASEMSGYVTGQTLTVDGGMVM